MRPQPRRRPITRKDYAQGQGRAPIASRASPRLAPPARVFARAWTLRLSRSSNRPTLRQIRESRRYMYTRSNTRDDAMLMRVRRPCDAAAVTAVAARSCQQEQTVN